MTINKILSSVLFISILFFYFLPTEARRDHLTTEEADMVREAQQLDKRIAIFIKAIERRFLAITNPQDSNSKQAQKDQEKWGALPTGTRKDLLNDISKIIDEAITNIDDASTKDSQKEYFPKAVKKLAEVSPKFISQLTPLRTSTDEAEREVIEQSLENLQSIIEAANKPLPSETK
jgi:acyl-CoA reductase-like NAD-dependent aldehyde dehydrogenase